MQFVTVMFTSMKWNLCEYCVCTILFDIEIFRYFGIYTYTLFIPIILL